jgi:hypothetical protein
MLDPDPTTLISRPNGRGMPITVRFALLQQTDPASKGKTASDAFE